MLAALLLVLAVVGIGAGALYYSPEWRDLTTFVSRMQEAPAPAASPPPQPIVVKPAAPVAVVAKEPAASPPAAPAPTPVALPAPPAQKVPATEATPPTAIAPAPVAAAEPSTPAKAQRTSVPKPGGVAKVIIAISPRGELYIDGKHLGTTPPVTTLDLEPGLHRIEIRSGSRKPYLTYMTVEAGDERRIRHDFNAKPSAPPR